MTETFSLMEKFKRGLGRDLPKAVQKNQRLICTVAVIFLISMGIAFIANQVDDNPINRAIEGQTEPYQRELEKEAEVERSPLEWTGFLLRNNLVSAIEVIGLGVGVGIFPIYSTLVNGLLIGNAVSSTTLSWFEILSALLPHGVFELTAYVLAISCGVKLGIGSIRGITKREIEPLKTAGNSVRSLVPGVILLLIIAGFIEGFISPYLGYILNLIKIGASLIAFLVILAWMSGKLTSPSDR